MTEKCFFALNMRLLIALPVRKERDTIKIPNCLFKEVKKTGVMYQIDLKLFLTTLFYIERAQVPFKYIFGACIFPYGGYFLHAWIGQWLRTLPFSESFREI